jgi:translation elongation factor EF-4
LTVNFHLSTRNFCIIAHIDHGKSTLADRLMQLTGAVPAGSRPQYLDKLQVSCCEHTWHAC